MSDTDERFQLEYEEYRTQLKPEREQVRELLQPWIRAEWWSSTRV